MPQTARVGRLLAPSLSLFSPSRTLHAPASTTCLPDAKRWLRVGQGSWCRASSFNSKQPQHEFFAAFAPCDARLRRPRSLLLMVTKVEVREDVDDQPRLVRHPDVSKRQLASGTDVVMTYVNPRRTFSASDVDMTFHIFGRFRYFGVSLDVRIYPPTICDDTAGVKTILVRQTAGNSRGGKRDVGVISRTLRAVGAPWRATAASEEARLFSFQTIGTYKQTQTLFLYRCRKHRGTKCDCYRLITRSCGFRLNIAAVLVGTGFEGTKNLRCSSLSKSTRPYLVDRLIWTPQCIARYPASYLHQHESPPPKQRH